jgi:molecular chaperone GrpE (heat shock protein)
MSAGTVSPKLPKWPFFLFDTLLLVLAYLFYWQSKTPMSPWDMFFCALCVVLAALIGVAPWLLEHRSATRLTEADRLTNAVLQIQNLEIIGRQIQGATANWQTAHEHANKSVEAAREIGDRITAEARAFADFLKKANDTEKNHLRLEVDKLRRAESEWVQVLIRILDHVFALYQAAVRSGQGTLVEQIGGFQNACRDVARRVGLIPFVAVPGEDFDPKIHQLAEPSAAASAEARIAETVATGYSFQGQLVRPVLVNLRQKHPDASDLSVSMLYQRREQSRGKDTPESRTQESGHAAETSSPPATDGIEQVPDSIDAEDAADQPASSDPEQEQLHL